MLHCSKISLGTTSGVPCNKLIFLALFLR